MTRTDQLESASRRITGGDKSEIWTALRRILENVLRLVLAVLNATKCPAVVLQLVSVKDLKEIGCEDGRWIELAEDRVQWQVLVLAVLNLCVLLLHS